MRILLASDSFDPAVGGVQRVVRDLADELVRRDHEVVVLAPWAPGLASSEDVGGLQVVRLRLGRPAWRLRALMGYLRRVPAARSRVRALLADVRPDVVHLHFLQSPLAHVLPAACRRAGVPLVATAHGRDVVGSMVEADPFGRRVVSRTLDLADVVTAPSSATLAHAKRWASVPVRALYKAVPNALPADMERWLSRPAPDSGRGVVAVGELHPKKGFDVLIRAVAAIGGLTLRIAGEGSHRQELTDLIAELGVGDRVELLGFVRRAELPRLLRSAAAQCVPSRREPFGLVILEAFACGIPVIASRVDGIPEACGPEAPAELVPPDDVDALAGALRRVFAEPHRRERMVAAGRVRAAQLSRARNAERYLEVYEMAMRGDTGDVG